MTTKYQPGFGNHFVSEAVAGVLVDGQNSPQHVPHGLYAELLSGTRVYRASGGESAHLGVPNPSVGCA